MHKIPSPASLPPMPPTPAAQALPRNIAIAGAGLVGRLLAWRLLLQGRAVTLFEQGRLDTPTSAAHTAAAMISPMSEVVISERAIYDMGCQSLSLWPQWLDDLNSARPKVHYQANGSLVVAHPKDQNELHQFHQELQYHLKTHNTARWLDKTALEQIEPDLAAQFSTALHLPDEAYLDNRGLLKALALNIKKLGGTCIENATISFEPDLTFNSKPQPVFDCVFDCRGLGAQQACHQLRGVRGEVLWVHTEEITLNHPIRLMHPRYKLYIVPKPDHHFIVGATEIESDDRSPVSVQSMLELCSALYTLNPAFAEARITELDANLRPSYLNNMPLISDQTHTLACGASQRVVGINGLYRHGYLLAPHMVQTVLNQLDQKNPICL